jgi:hypothetical protein
MCIDNLLWSREMNEFISGIFPEMVIVWCGAMAIIGGWLIYDGAKADPVSTRGRISVAVVIFVCLSVTMVAYEWTQYQDEPKFAVSENAVWSCNGGLF